MGIYTSGVPRAHTGNAVQDFVGTSALITLIFLPIPAHINFVQYFYCKKYRITCDEYGDTTSPKPVYCRRQKSNKATQKDASPEHPNLSVRSPERNLLRWIKIQVGILCVLVILVFLVFFINRFIKGIS